MSARDRILLTVIAVGAVLAGFWFGVVSPRSGELADVRAQMTVARQAGDEALAQLSQGVAAKRAHSRDLAMIARLGKAVPHTADQASLLYQLQDAAGRSRVAITAVSPGGAPVGVPAAPAPAASAAASPTGVESLPVTLEFEGTYRDLEGFLRRIQRFTKVGAKTLAVRGRLVAVQSVTLTGDGTGDEPVSATIQALAYVVPAAAAVLPPGVAGAAPGSVPAGASAPLPTTPAVIGAAG